MTNNILNNWQNYYYYEALWLHFKVCNREKLNVLLGLCRFKWRKGDLWGIRSSHSIWQFLKSNISFLWNEILCHMRSDKVVDFFKMVNNFLFTTCASYCPFLICMSLQPYHLLVFPNRHSSLRPFYNNPPDWNRLIGKCSSTKILFIPSFIFTIFTSYSFVMR